jgi:amidase
MNLHFKAAAEIARLIRERKVSAVDALEHFLARIEKYNPRLNAVIWLDPGRGARAPARRTLPSTTARYGARCTACR